MIKIFAVTNYLGDRLEIDLARPTMGLAIHNIDGIAGSSASVNLGEYASTDGGYFNSSRTLSRVITIDMKFLDNASSYDDARRLSYQFFPVKHKVTLEFITEDRHSMIVGYVERNNAKIFSDAVGTSITIVCPKADLESALIDEEWFYGEEPGFHFPFANHDLIKKTLVFGEVKFMDEEVITYTGEKEVGILISAKVSGEVVNIRLHNTVTMESMTIITENIKKITGKPLGIGDELLISSVAGDKYARLLRDGVTHNILNAISRDSDWLVLAKGDNVFSYTAEVGSDDLTFRISYRALFEGV